MPNRDLNVLTLNASLLGFKSNKSKLLDR
jgi:hypothetical protein